MTLSNDGQELKKVVRQSDSFHHDLAIPTEEINASAGQVSSVITNEVTTRKSLLLMTDGSKRASHLKG
jgi:hypothetical protein